MNSLYLNVPLEAVRGARQTRRFIEERVGWYEEMRKKVIREMGAKGFPPNMVEDAVASCEAMLEFYEDLLETF
ncbi:hypothetical protein LCGC14_0264840 [marine sediment metagenome]|uniref:Uncharacterized protein n=1 Tax=marine sediment metagenome TaxID=412755 RepID=A0A0F9WLK7_9ZZZZ